MAKGKEGVVNDLSSWLTKFICKHQIQIRKTEKETYRQTAVLHEFKLPGSINTEVFAFSIIVCLKICKN